MKKPLVSIIIVNWNGKKYLEMCLKSLAKISYKNVETIVVDQNSVDGSADFVSKKFPKTKIIRNKQNTGYVGGNNSGVSKSRGKYIIILNNDIEVDSNFLEPLVEAFEKDKKLGCAQPKAINLRYKGKLDGGGSFFTKTGFLFHKGYLKRASDVEYNIRYKVYSVKGAYMMTRRKLFNKLGGLDKDFFIYFEESDYCGRVWLSGSTVEYIPTSLVYHWGAGDTSGDWKKRFALVQYRSFKNRISSYLKNLSLKNLLILMPIHFVICEGLSFYYLLTASVETSISIQRALLWNLLNINKIIVKRRKVQRMRKTSDSDIFAIVGRNVGIGYYINLLFLLKKK